MMTRIFIFFALVFNTIFYYSQSTGITYQALIINPKGENVPGVNNTSAPLANKEICMRFSIYDSNNLAEYVETIKTTTDKAGIVNLIIGTGNKTAGYANSFSGIVWDKNLKRLKVEFDENANCSNYLEISNQTFSYVPFTYYSSSTKEATATTTGSIQLAGDLAGVGSTAKSPKITDGAITSSKLANGAVVNSKIGELISVNNGGTGASNIVGYVVGNGTNAMTGVTSIPVNDVNGAQTTANLEDNITTSTDPINKYPSVKAVADYIGNSIAVATIPDASNIAKGKVQLAGDLTGTAASPAIATGAVTTTKIADEAITDAKVANGISASKVGLGNVNNTSDADKPVSTAQQTALNLKENLSNKSTDITADAASTTKYPAVKAIKDYVDSEITTNATPDATATVKGKLQLAGDLTGTAASPEIAAGAVTTAKIADEAITDAKVANGISASKVGLENVDNTSDADKPVSTAQQTALDLKEDLANKSTDITTDAASTTKYPAVKAIKDYVDSEITTNATPDATATVKGKLQLAGDLTGTAASPEIAAGAVTTDKLADASVTNDKIAEPVSIANGGTGSSSQNFVDLTTDQTIEGVKTFSSDIIANGVKVGKGNGNGDSNVAVGTDLGTGTGYRNTGVGAGALQNFSGTSFGNNTGIGFANMQGLTTGYGNTSLGGETLASVDNNDNNTAIGNQTLRNAASSNNTALGANAGNFVTTGSGNTFLGSQADIATGTNSNATAIGYGAIVDGDNTIQLGNSNVILVKTSGKLTTGDVTYPNTNGTAGQFLETDGNGNAIWTDLPAIDTANLVDAAVTDAKIANGISASKVGLENVDNTSDADKPVSTAQQTALDLKENLSNKSTDITADAASNTKYPAVKAIKDYVDSSIASATIADADATTKGKLQLAGDLTGTAASPEIAADAVTSAKILDGTIVVADIADNAIETAKIKDANVTTAKIADAAITTAKIKDANVTDAKLDKANIPLSGFGSAAADVDLGSNKLTNVTNPTSAQDAATKSYVDTSVAAATIADADATTKGKLQLAGDLTGTAASPEIAANAVTSAKILDGTIVVADIADNAVETAKIKNANVTYAKIQNVSATDKVLGRVSTGAGTIEEISTTGSGNVVRATSPTLVTPNLGTPSAVDLTNATNLPLSAVTGTLSVAKGGTGLTSLSAGYIPFGNGTNAFGNSANLFWDNTNARLGINTSTPSATFQIGTDCSSCAENLKYFVSNSYNTFKLGFRSTGWQMRASNNSGVATDLLFSYDNGSTITDRMTIGTSGNVAIPGTLDVTGNAKAGTGEFSNLNVGTWPNYDINYSSSTGKLGIFGTPTAPFQIYGDGGFEYPLKYSSDGQLGGTLGFGFRNKQFKISTTSDSGVLNNMIYSYDDGNSNNTEIMRLTNDGKLYISGGLQILSNASAGKVLTSDANGNAAWASIPALADDAVSSAKIADGTITNADVATTAAIAYSKLNLTGSIATADIANAAITTAKLNDGAVTSAKIADGTITNADVATTAAIAFSKLDISKADIEGLGIPGADNDTTYTAGTGLSLSGTVFSVDSSVATKTYVDTATNAINTLADGKIYIGNASNVATELALSGDVTMTNAGVTSIGTGKVTSTKILDGAVTNAKITDATIDLTTKVTGALPIANGGTGATTKSAAFDALSPMSASGDIIYGGTSGTGTRLAKGTDGQVLTLVSGVPAWSNSGGTASVLSKTASYTITATDNAKYLVFSGSTASQTVTLPSAVTVGAGREITIKNVASVSLTINATAGYLISDSTTTTASSLAIGIEPSNNWIKAISDGTNWIILRALF